VLLQVPGVAWDEGHKIKEEFGGLSSKHLPAYKHSIERLSLRQALTQGYNMSSLLQPLQRDDLRLHSGGLGQWELLRQYEAVKKPPQTWAFWMDENFSSCMPMHQTTDAEQGGRIAPVQFLSKSFSPIRNGTDGLLLAQRIEHLLRDRHFDFRTVTGDLLKATQAD
jgi:hypothetical protein